MKKRPSTNPQQIKANNKYRQTIKGKLSTINQGAKKRGLTVDEPFITPLLSQPCYYCGTKEKVSIDRIDNYKGYIEGNCLPCCTQCNLVRGYTLTVEETKVAIQAVINFRNKN